MRRVATFTGSRAEAGHIEAIAAGIQADPRLSHVPIRYTIPPHPDTLAGVAASMGDTIKSMVVLLSELRPDVFVVYGDRSEAFAACVAGTQLAIPTAHVEGGDVTNGGALDDNLRYSMTALAHLHFATNEQAAERLIALGEEAWRVHTVGLPILDLVAQGAYAEAAEVLERYKLFPLRPLLVFCQHAIATESTRALRQVSESISALLKAQDRLEAQLVVIEPNGDAGGGLVKRALMSTVWDEEIYGNIPRADYHGLLAIASAVVGNSSAGLKEAPAFHCPAVNIGARQAGRLKGDNVIDAGYDSGSIYAAIKTAIKWRREGRKFTNPYGACNAGRQIAEVLATVPLDARLLQKRKAA